MKYESKFLRHVDDGNDLGRFDLFECLERFSNKIAHNPEARCGRRIKPALYEADDWYLKEVTRGAENI